MDIHELLPSKTPELFQIPAAKLVLEAMEFPNYPRESGPEVKLFENPDREIVAQVLKNTLSADGVVHKIMFSEPHTRITRTIELSLDDVNQLRSVLQLEDERTLTVADGKNTYKAKATRLVFSQEKGKPGPGETNVGIVMISPKNPGPNRKIYRAIADYMSNNRTVEDYDSERYEQSQTAARQRQPTSLENQVHEALIALQVMGPRDKTLDELVLPNLPKTLSVKKQD